MTKALFLISAFLFMNQPAQADEERSEMNAQICVGALKQTGRFSAEQAEYTCGNPYLKPRASDTAEQEKMRAELARQADEAKKEFFEKAQVDEGSDAKMKDHFDALNEEGAND